MSTAAVLPRLWATWQETTSTASAPPLQPVPHEIAFYRKYTEGMLRRYLRLSMESGKVPSLLGKEMFRGKVTNYQVAGFDDMVIFVHDVQRCLERLDESQQLLISRIALQQFTIDETAGLLKIRPKTVVRHYRQAVDRLTRVFLQVGMLNPQTSCQ